MLASASSQSPQDRKSNHACTEVLIIDETTRDVRYTSPAFVSHVLRMARIFWLFTKDDFDTFVLPNTVFGIVAALVEARCTTTVDARIVRFVLSHIPHTILFNWANLFIFDLANQRLPDSIAEDRINKPWRPLPRGLLSPQAVSQIMLAAIPVILVVSYSGGTAVETALLMLLTWIYNDLRGGDEHWVLRNGIIAAAFFLYNLGSTKIAGGQHVSAGPFTWRWAATVSAIIFTTMHVQDFKDQSGDRVRGRHTAPIALGNDLARWTVAVPVLFWSVVCTVGLGVLFWHGVLILGLGGIVAWRGVYLRKREEDRRTWKYWCLWCAALYGVPLTGNVFSMCASRR